MLGAIIGDIVGSVYEFNNYRAKDFSPFFHPKAFFTDDTVCTIAVADALLFAPDTAFALKDWGRRYWENGGWGGQFAQWLVSEDWQAYGSYGNGAAMRVSPAGLIARSVEHAVFEATRVTIVTHNHPEGMKGAQATAVAIYLALAGSEPEQIRQEIESRFAYDLSATVDEIRPNYQFDESCQGTVPQALICALSATSYEDAIRNAISIGGDSDTIAAIAGGVAEGLFGVPISLARQGLSYLPAEMLNILQELYRQADEPPPWQR